MKLRPRQEIGTVPWEPDTYGRSVLGAPLEVWRPAGRCEVLLFAGIHGEEAESTLVLSRALRCLGEPSPHCAIVLAANPDGLSRGTRGNARGVELNRNFPSKSWRADAVPHRATMEDPRDVLLSPGSQPASEPETRALLALIGDLAPRTVIALHAPLACIEDPARGALAAWLAERTGLELIGDVGYPTPGSFGSWAIEQGLEVITYELPLTSSEELVRVHTPVLIELLAREEL